MLEITVLSTALCTYGVAVTLLFLINIRKQETRIKNR